MWKAAVVANCHRDRSMKVCDVIFFRFSGGLNSQASSRRTKTRMTRAGSQARDRAFLGFTMGPEARHGFLAGGQFAYWPAGGRPAGQPGERPAGPPVVELGASG